VKRTCCNVAGQKVGEFDDRTVRVLGVVFAGDDCRILAAKNEALVLSLQQKQNLVEQNDVQIDLLGSTDAPRQRSFVQHPVLGQIELLLVRVQKQTRQLLYIRRRYPNTPNLHFDRVHRLRGRLHYFDNNVSRNFSIA
jgi:hypothetical protein